MRRSALVLTTVSLAGCGAGWHQVPAEPTTAIPPRKQVLVYHHGGAPERWHAARISEDSISGIHWLSPIEGDTGRVALPLAAVDSIQVGDPAQGFVKSYLLSVYVILPVAYVALCVTIGACPVAD